MAVLRCPLALLLMESHRLSRLSLMEVAVRPGSQPPRSVHIIWRGIIDLIFPPRCGGCNSAGSLWCETCQASLVYVSPPICSRCGNPLMRGDLCPPCQSSPPVFESVRSVVIFDGPIRNAIHALKYRRVAALGDTLGDLLAQTWSHVFAPMIIDMIIPVPLHVQRQRERGYNQSELLARRLQHKIDVPLRPGALRRVRATTSQMTLEAAQRRVNVAGAFEAVPAQVHGQRVLLIDDVCTTSATLNACAIALRQAGACEIWGLTLARTP